MDSITKRFVEVMTWISKIPFWIIIAIYALCVWLVRAIFREWQESKIGTSSFMLPVILAGCFWLRLISSQTGFLIVLVFLVIAGLVSVVLRRSHDTDIQKHEKRVEDCSDAVSGTITGSLVTFAVLIMLMALWPDRNLFAKIEAENDKAKVSRTLLSQKSEYEWAEVADPPEPAGTGSLLVVRVNTNSSWSPQMALIDPGGCKEGIIELKQGDRVRIEAKFFRAEGHRWRAKLGSSPYLPVYFAEVFCK